MKGGGPRIIVYDLETLPNLPEALKQWTNLSNYPGQTLKASISSIICAGYKVLGEKQVHCINAWDFPSWKKDVNDDRAVCEALFEILKDADCVVTHNGKRFDWKFFQTRLMYHGIGPLPKIHHVDTCAEAKKNLLVFNNRLNTLSQFFTDQKKMDHEGWELWVKVHARDKKAMSTMEKYCKQDVVALEAVFKKLRPLIKSLPNQNLFNPLKAKCCPNCGSSRLNSRGWMYAATKTYRRYQCQDCAAWSRTDAKDEAPR
jgi:hypothetical protein